MLKITKTLLDMAEIEYAEFISKITPNIPRSNFIGIRVPILRKLAKEYIKDEESKIFLSTLPHQYYEENLLHGMLISLNKDFNETITLLNAFLPYVDNWAVNDTMKPVSFKKHLSELVPFIKTWLGSSDNYAVRFGILMLMTYYLGEEYQKEYLDWVCEIESDYYYINMMQAWYLATALIDHWIDVVQYLEQKKLSPFVHRKTISKAIESYRITDEQKEYLRSLK